MHTETRQDVSGVYQFTSVAERQITSWLTGAHLEPARRAQLAL